MNLRKIYTNYFFSSMLLLVACSSNTATESTNPLVGKWSTPDSTKIEFKENGKATFDGAEMSYTSGHDTLTLIQGNVKLSYFYNIKDDKLVIAGGDLKIPLHCTRVTGGSILAKTEKEKTPEENTKASILGKKENAGTTEDTPTPAKAGAKTIYDTWISPEETIELKSDGNCIYRGVAYKFEYDGNLIVVKTDKGDYTFGCKLNGDQLILSTAQGSYAYSRKGTKAVASGGSRGGGQELVGKWCYMSNSKNISFNDCFTIDANGTYSYNSDNSMSANTGSVAENSNNSGTWTFDGNTIHVRSYGGSVQNYPIQKTYNKNGDPCIVIGGKTYFSAYQHARW